MNLNEKDIFKQRFYSKIIFVLIIILLYIISSIISGFQNGMAFSSIPAGIFWLIQKFIPTPHALQYFPEFCFANSFTRHNCHNNFSNICPISRNNRLKLNWNQHFYKNYNKSNRFIF